MSASNAAAAPAVPTTRLATVDDATELARLRRLMFEAMGQPADDPAAWEAATAEVFRRFIAGDDPWRGFVGIVVDAPDGEGRLAASAVAEVMERLPGPRRVPHRWAYVSSISTDPGYRRRGFARAATVHLLDELQAQDVARIDLHATAEGRPLYESLGFAIHGAQPEMRLMP